jgi:hypothetical protein
MAGNESGDMPADPFSAMAAAAVSLHEMYRSFVTAGFSEAQAFELVRSMVVRQLGGGS